QRDVHHGGLPAGRVLRGVGSHLPAVSDRRIYLTSEQSKGKQEKPGPDRHVGSIYFRDLITEDPVRDGKLPHMTGTGLGAILFGPSAVSILGIIVLVFQAVLLAHGGLTTLGANTFSMAIAGPLVSFGIYKLCTHTKMNRRAGIFL